MKVIVISNCATGAYTETLRFLFPSYDVRGARLDLAWKWIEQSDKPFLDFCRAADLAVGLGTRPDIVHIFPSRTSQLEIPSFMFRGLHPDIFQMPLADPPCADRPLANPLKSGLLWSRIIMAGFLMGYSPDQTTVCFNEEVYDALGHFEAFAAERDMLFRSFDDKGICLREPFERWRRMERFLYTPNHPAIAVFVDILIAAWNSHVGQIEQSRVAAVLQAGLPDELATSIVWPIYPEIAERQGMNGSFTWWTSGPDRIRHGLTDFVELCYLALANARDSVPGLFPDWERVGDILHSFLKQRSRHAV